MRRGPEGTAQELGAGRKFHGRGAGPGVHDSWGASLRGERGGGGVWAGSRVKGDPGL